MTLDGHAVTECRRTSSVGPVCPRVRVYSVDGVLNLSQEDVSKEQGAVNTGYTTAV